MFNKIEDPAGHLSVRLYAIYKSKEIGSREKFVWLFKRCNEYFTLNIFCTVFIYYYLLLLFIISYFWYITILYILSIIINLHRIAETLILASDHGVSYERLYHFRLYYYFLLQTNLINFYRMEEKMR